MRSGATLDGRAQLDGMPFMPEMWRFCGRRFRVEQARAHKTCDTVDYVGGRRLLGAPYISRGCAAAARRTGAARRCAFSSGRRRGCEAWTARECRGSGGAADVRKPALGRAPALRTSRRTRPIRPGVCQATRLLDASVPLRRSDLGQYVEDFTSGNVSLRRMLAGFTFLGYATVVGGRYGTGRAPAMGLRHVPAPGGAEARIPTGRGRIPAGGKTPSRPLDLRPGELVRVRALPEILETVDENLRNRGMGFHSEMVPFTGGTYRVLRRIERIVHEKTGKMVHLKNDAVILEDVVCQARYINNCRAVLPPPRVPLLPRDLARAGGRPGGGVPHAGGGIAMAPARPGARVLLVSLRRSNAHAAWCSNYEFEDVIQAVDDVDVLELGPGRHAGVRQRVARSLAWHGRHRLFRRLNPGVHPVALERNYDLLVFVCMNVWDLLYLNAVKGWRERARVKACYMVELYTGFAQRHPELVRLLADFDHVAQAFSGNVDTLAGILSKPCHHVPLAADVSRFTPYPDPPRRVIDVLSVGRRAEGVHRELRRLSAARGLFYLYDTIPGPLVRPGSPVEHREMLASAARRSRFFVAYPAKFGDEENGGQLEVGARYYEGTAAGAVLLGQAPTAPAFRADFPWPGAVVETRADGSDVAEVLSNLEARPAEVERISHLNATTALRRHDWAHRWRSLLEIAGIPPRPALAQRLGALERLAGAGLRPAVSQ